MKPIINKIKTMLTLSVLSAISIAVTGCSTLFEEVAVPTDAFKDSYYREFPAPDATPEWTADHIDFWCANRPDEVPDHVLCILLVDLKANAEGSADI